VINKDKFSVIKPISLYGLIGIIWYFGLFIYFLQSRLVFW
jgi:hypothetical protein